MRVRRNPMPLREVLFAALTAPALVSATMTSVAGAAPPAMPPLFVQPYGFQQQLLPGQPEASYITPKPMAPMQPLFNMPTSPFGEMGIMLGDSPTQSVPHRQPIAPDPKPGSAAKAVANPGPKLMPAPGFTKGPAHRRPLGW